MSGITSNTRKQKIGKILSLYDEKRQAESNVIIYF